VQNSRERPHGLPASIDACVIDLDGTLTMGLGLTRGAAALIAAAAPAFVVLSNNSSHDAPGLAAELAQRGLPVPAERIVLAGVEAVAMLARERPGQRVMLLASPAIAQVAIASGLVCDDAQPDSVLVARDERFSYERLERAANAVRRGARLVAANGDFTHPGPADTVVPETGALLAALRACCPGVECRIAGKPQTPLFAAALRILGTRPERTLMIGDNDTTDGEGARRMGMPFLRVRDCDVTDAAALVRIRRA
jgi:HAD superfamily hydrolase (TIGR01450 family)